MQKQRIYLDNACAGIYPEKVLEVPLEFVNLMRNDTITAGDKNLVMRGFLALARERVAQLIHCHPDEVALVESTTHAMGIVTGFFDFRPKDNVLVCDLEYQASFLCLRPKQKKEQFEIRAVPNEIGRASCRGRVYI